MPETLPSPQIRTLTENSGFQRLTVHHVTLPPGSRSSIPHAESLEDEWVYVLKGEPHAWIDGFLSPLKPGCAGAFPAGTGIAHSFLNNTSSDVELIVIGERSKKENKYVYPVNLELRAEHASAWWSDAPARSLGPHKGLPGPVRPEDLAKELPSCLVFAPGLPRKRGFHYAGDDEMFGYAANLSRAFGIKNFGLWFESLMPGTRSSWPHAHALEEEFAFVLRGTVTVWVNGKVRDLGPGDSIAFTPGTNEAHVLINDTDQEAVYLMLGDGRDADFLYYPLHEFRNLQCQRHGDFWKDGRPERKLGPHPGTPQTPRENSLRILPVRHDYPALEVFAVERDGKIEGELTLVVTAEDSTSCSVRWSSEEELRGDVAELVQHYLKEARRIEGVEFLFN